MSDTTATELAEQNAQNIKQIAEALDMKPSKLHTGASREQHRKATEKAAALGIAGETEKDTRSDETVAGELMLQNARNIARIAEHVGVPGYKISGEVTSTEVERAKVAALGLDTEPPAEDRTKAEVFGLSKGGD